MPDRISNPASTTIDFLLVIPAFKESLRLPEFLASLADELEAEPFQTRILVVDDGSGKEEQEALTQVVSGLSRRYPLILAPLLLPANQGKGGAIMAGWSSDVSAAWLGFADADGATPAREVARVLRMAARQKSDRGCLFASRIRLMGRSVNRKLSRHLMGRVYSTLVGCLIHPGVYDSQCGFKMIPAEAFRTVKDRIDERRFAFDVDLLAALIDSGIPVEEVPIDWQDIPGSKVSFVKDTARMFASLLRIRRKRKKFKLAAKQSERVELAVR